MLVGNTDDYLSGSCLLAFHSHGGPLRGAFRGSSGGGRGQLPAGVVEAVKRPLHPLRGARVPVTDQLSPATNASRHPFMFTLYWVLLNWMEPGSGRPHCVGPRSLSGKPERSHGHSRCDVIA